MSSSGRHFTGWENVVNSYNGMLCGRKSNVLEVYLITQENIHTMLSVRLLSQVMKRNIQDYPYFVKKKKKKERKKKKKYYI